MHQSDSSPPKATENNDGPREMVDESGRPFSPRAIELIAQLARERDEARRALAVVTATLNEITGARTSAIQHRDYVDVVSQGAITLPETAAPIAISVPVEPITHGPVKGYDAEVLARIDGVKNLAWFLAKSDRGDFSIVELTPREFDALSREVMAEQNSMPKWVAHAPDGCDGTCCGSPIKVVR